MINDTCPTVRFDIFIAGDPADARRICRQYCMDVGFCVTVEAIDYIYTGGQESGVRVGVINYARFPSNHDDLYCKTAALADLLMNGLYQESYSIVGPNETLWVSRRDY